MKPHINSDVSELSGAELEAIGAALDDLEIDGLDDGAIEEAVEAESDVQVADALADLDVLDDADEAALELIDAKDAHYAEQEGAEAELEAPAKVKKTKKAAAPKEPKAKKEPSVRDPANLPDSEFVLIVGQEADKAGVLSLRPKQKKIAEKFDNLFTALARGAKPSTYVMDCYAVLKAKGEVTGVELVAALKAEGYTDGTARSQAGQIMELFRVTQIAFREKGQLTLNPNSVIAERLDAVA